MSTTISPNSLVHIRQLKRAWEEVLSQCPEYWVTSLLHMQAEGLAVTRVTKMNTQDNNIL
jgi:hypothetical protein